MVNVNVNPQMSDDVDYSDFEYDFFRFTTSQSSTGNGTVLTEFEPLAGQGGLRPNQVAEIVYMELVIQGTAPESVTGDASTYEQRGTWGINIDSESDDVTGGTFGSASVSQTVLQGSFVNFTANEGTDPAILIPYGVTGQDDMVLERNWRALTGRGPVIDANDTLNNIHTSISESGDSNDFQMYLHLVYDLFELDDSRTAFSVPK